MLLRPGGQSLLVHLPAAGGAPLELAPVPQPELCPPPQPGVALDSPGLHAGGGVKDATPPGAGRGLGRHAHRWLGRVVVCVGGPPSLPLVLGGGASAPHRGNPFPPNTHYWTAPPWTAPRQRGGCTGAPGRVLVGLWGALCTRISERVRDACAVRVCGARVRCVCAVRVCGEQALGSAHLCPAPPSQHIGPRAPIATGLPQLSRCLQPQNYLPHAILPGPTYAPCTAPTLLGGLSSHAPPLRPGLPAWPPPRVF